jgi:hypothetical protein
VFGVEGDVEEAALAAGLDLRGAADGSCEWAVADETEGAVAFGDDGLAAGEELDGPGRREALVDEGLDLEGGPLGGADTLLGLGGSQRDLA